MQRFAEPTESVGVVKSSSALALCFMALGVALGLLLGVSPVEPLLDFSRVDADSLSCTRGHWQRFESADSNFWRFETWFELGAPARTLKTATRIDQTAHGALIDAGVAATDATTVLKTLANRSAARFGAGALVVSAAEISSTLANPVRAPSSYLENCVLPVDGLSIAICDDYLTLTRNPDASDTTYRERHAFLVVAPGLMSAAAQRLGLQAELFIDAGPPSGAVAYAVTIGATTFCACASRAPLPRLRNADDAESLVRIEAAFDAATGRLVGAPHPTQERCDYPTTSGGATELFPLRSASGADTLGSADAIGFSDEDAFDAAVCASGVSGGGGGGGTPPSAVVACASSATQCAGYTASLPLADAARRSIVVNRTNTGSVILTMERERSGAWWTISELALALWRLLVLSGTVLVAEERARIGVNAQQLLQTAMGWAQSPTGDSLKGDQPTPEGVGVHHPTAAIAMSAMRIWVYTLSWESRLVNRMHYVLVCDGLSIGLSIFITAARLATGTRSVEHDLACYGGSTWITDGVLSLLSLSVGQGPLHESIASHGFQAVSRIAAGTLLLIQVIPRAIVSVGVCAAFATNRNFLGTFRTLNAAALLAWTAQVFLVSTLTAHLFIYALLYSSSAAVTHPLLMYSLAAMASIISVTVYVVSLLEAVLGHGQSL